MSKWNYITSTFKPTSVSDAVVLNFLSENTRCLCVGKAERLEIYKITEDSVELFSEIMIFGQICCLKALKTQSSTQDSLLIVTDNRKLLQVEYSLTGNLVSEVVLVRKNAKLVENSQLIINHNNSLCLISTELSYFTMIQIHNNKLGESFMVSHKDLPLIDFTFITGSSSVAALYAKGETYLLQFYDILEFEKRLIPQNEPFPFDSIPSKIISPSPRSILVFFRDHYLYFASTDSDYIKTPFPFSDLSAVCQTSPSLVVISNTEGKLFLLTLDFPEVSIDFLGSTSIPACICYLDNSIFFIGSKLNNSKLIKILSQSPQDTESYIEELQEFQNIGPILDFKLLEDGHRRVFDLITCSGIGSSGGFRKITKGVRVVTEFETQIANINGIWNLKIDSEFHTHLVLSFIARTMILEIVKDNIKKCVVGSGVVLEESTVYISRYDKYVFHVVSSGIFVYSDQWNLVAYTKADKIAKGCIISQGHCSERMICVALSCLLVALFEIVDGVVTEKWRIPCKSEVACLCLYTDFIALGYWETKELIVFDVKTAEVVFKDSETITTELRSARFIRVETQLWMVVGLRDGSLIYYHYENNTFCNKHKLSIGYQGILLENFSMSNREFLIAACDNPMILYSENLKIHATCLNLKDVLFITSFHTDISQNCLAVVTKSSLSVVSLPDLQQYSLKSYIKNITIRRIAIIFDKYVTIALTATGIHTLQLYDNEKDRLDCMDFPLLESLNCIYVIGSRIYVGSGISDSTEKDPCTGRVLVFSIVASKLNLVSEIAQDGSVNCICGRESHLIAGVYKSIHYFKIVGDNLELIDSNQKLSYVFRFDTYEDLVAVVDLYKTISVYQPIDNKLVLLYKNYNICYATAIKFLDRSSIIIADSYGNIALLKASQSNILSIISAINIGTEIVNCINTTTVSSGNTQGVSAVFGTTKGRIGRIMALSEANYTILAALQAKLIEEKSKYCACIDNELRIADKVVNAKAFIQGDVVEGYLDLGKQEQQTLAIFVSENVGRTVKAEELSEILFEIVK